MRSNQRPDYGMRARQARQRADADQKRDRQGGDAVNADVAVAHDLEFLLAALAAAKAVGGVGEPVLMQTAGDQHRRRDGERRGRPWRQSGAMSEPVNESADDADHEAGKRKRP